MIALLYHQRFIHCSIIGHLIQLNLFESEKKRFELNAFHLLNFASRNEKEKKSWTNYFWKHIHGKFTVYRKMFYLKHIDSCIIIRTLYVMSTTWNRNLTNSQLLVRNACLLENWSKITRKFFLQKSSSLIGIRELTKMSECYGKITKTKHKNEMFFQFIYCWQAANVFFSFFFLALSVLCGVARSTDASCCYSAFKSCWERACVCETNVSVYWCWQWQCSLLIYMLKVTYTKEKKNSYDNYAHSYVCTLDASFTRPNNS